MLFIASITLSFFFGYFIFRYEKVAENRQEIKVVPEINPKVCTVDIERISGGVVRGKFGEKQVRLRYLGNVIFPGDSGEFEFEFE